MSDVGVIVVLALVTASFRVIPLVFRRPAVQAGHDAPPDRPGSSDLAILPLAVLTALVVPGAAAVDAANAWVGILAVLSAVAVVVVKRDAAPHVVIAATVAGALVAHLVLG